MEKARLSTLQISAFLRLCRHSCVLQFWEIFTWILCTRASKMAIRSEPRFLIPPPPEDEPHFSASQFQSQLSTQRSAVHLMHKCTGDVHSSWPSEDDFTGGLVEGDSREGLQMVPGTPHHKQEQWREAIHHIPNTENLHLRYSYEVPSHGGGGGQVDVQLKSVMEIPEKYRRIFPYPYFNIMQSKVFDKVLYTDLPLVVSAPTGSGKTVVFELAILRLLIQLNERVSSVKIVYVAPIKALCSERCEEWRERFRPLGLECTELTGDTEMDDFFELQKANIITTTPEKWDSMTRRWKDNKSLIQLVRLFLIDEVHQLNDPHRGPTVEAIVSRMKTVQSSMLAQECGRDTSTAIRFLAVSATIPNISDVAAWLGSEGSPAVAYNIDESHRPVHLRKVVLGYPESSSMFKFDCSLNYRLSSVIHTYSEDKPTLVFCATRKGTQQAASTLLKDARFVINAQHKTKLLQVANSLRDSKLRDVVVYGVGYHHAGLDATDRKTMETMFLAGELPVLFCTSTLAMGVNLPAHLVVVKSTQQYANNGFCEYSETQILQMIGRAGRPQFDTTATAVIMTRNSTKGKYESLMNGSQLIESSLHANLIEHLNAEVVLGTITDVSIALEWLKSTFLFVRIKQNPKHYGIPAMLAPGQLEEKLQEMCLKDLNLLELHGLITLVEGFDVKPTTKGRLMAQYCVAFESTKKFLSVKGTEQLSEMLAVLVSCAEFEDVRLRVNEKRTLNTLNNDKNRQTIRFPMNGKIKTTEMKINCLIQASLGMLPLQDFSLNQDTQKVFRLATRLSKCLMELQYQENHMRSLVSAVVLCKCVRAKLWENSKHVAKQLEKIGVTLSTALVNAGMTSFQHISATNPRELELILNKHPPFGNQLKDAVSKLPRYSLTVAQTDSKEPRKSQAHISITVHLTNCLELKQNNVLFRGHQGVILVVGDQTNKVVFKQKIMDVSLLGSDGRVTRSFAVNRCHKSDELELSLIHTDYVGLDCHQKFTPIYSVQSVEYRGSQPPYSREPADYKGPQPPYPREPADYKGPQPPYPGEATELLSNSNQTLDHFSIGFDEYMYEEEDDLTTLPLAGHTSVQAVRTMRGPSKPCNHRCTNKQYCGHECCKIGTLPDSGKRKQVTNNRKQQENRKQQDYRKQQENRKQLENRKHEHSGGMENYLAQLRAKTKDIPQTPLNRLKVMTTPTVHSLSPSLSSLTSLTEKFSYKRKEKPTIMPSSVSSAPPATHFSMLTTRFPPPTAPPSTPAHKSSPELVDTPIQPPPTKRGLPTTEQDSIDVCELFDNFDSGDEILVPMLNLESDQHPEDSGVGMSLDVSPFNSKDCRRGSENATSTSLNWSSNTGGWSGNSSTPIQYSAKVRTTTPMSLKRSVQSSAKETSFMTSLTAPKRPSLQPRNLVPTFRTVLAGECALMDPTTGQPKISYTKSSPRDDTPQLSSPIIGNKAVLPVLPEGRTNPSLLSGQFTSFFTSEPAKSVVPELQITADLFDGIL